MRDPLVGQLGEGRALGLNLLDRLRSIRGDEEGQKFRLKRLVLYLRSSGLTRSRGLLVEQFKLVGQARLESPEVSFARARIDKGKKVGEEIALSESGSHSGLLKEDIEFR